MVAITIRVLAVARDALNGMKILTALERLGCSVDVASTGLDALKLIRDQGPYDLIVTELLLNGISGLALVITAREKNPTVRSIAVNNGSETLQQFVMDYGVDSVLTPPLTEDEVYEAARRIMGGRRVRTTWRAAQIGFKMAP
jgi:CheY-like chemotaxis protein